MKTRAIQAALQSQQSHVDSWHQVKPSGGYVQDLSTMQLWDLMGVRSNIFDNDPCDIVSDIQLWDMYGDGDSFL